MDDARVREHLRQFGLSDTEVETLVSRHGVYTVCERLAGRVLVVTDESSSPTRLRAVPPEEAITESLSPCR